jgi:hypothetical protein
MEESIGTQWLGELYGMTSIFCLYLARNAWWLLGVFVKFFFLRNWNGFLNVYLVIYIYCGELNIFLFFIFVGWQISKELSIERIS